MATLRCTLPLLLASFFILPAAPAVREPRRWFKWPPSAPNAVTHTTTITATRALTEIHLSSCLVPPTQLPTCPPQRDDSGADSAQPYRLSSGGEPLKGPSPLPAGRFRPMEHPGAAAWSQVRQPLDPREDGRSWAESRTFSGLQSMFMQVLHIPGGSSATPPLPKAPAAATVTHTVTVNHHRTGVVPTTTSTVSFTLSGCLPSQMPFPIEPCEGVGGEQFAPLITINPAAVVPPEAPATAPPVSQGKEESGSGDYDE